MWDPQLTSPSPISPSALLCLLFLGGGLELCYGYEMILEEVCEGLLSLYPHRRLNLATCQVKEDELCQDREKGSTFQ